MPESNTNIKEDNNTNTPVTSETQVTPNVTNETVQQNNDLNSVSKETQVVNDGSLEVKTENQQDEKKEEVKEKKKDSLSYENREINLKYRIRAVCVINEVYKIIDQAISENINEYKLMYAYEEQLYTMGYETKDGKHVFAVWCPDGSVRTFETMDELKRKVTLGHNVTILREFVTGPDGKVAEVPIEDNFMLRNFLVHNNKSDYYQNMSEEIHALMEKLADSKIERVDKESKSTLIIMAIIVVIVLVFVFFFLK